MGAFSFANILLPDILHDLIVQRLGCVCVVGADDVDALVNRQHDAGLIARVGVAGVVAELLVAESSQQKPCRAHAADPLTVHSMLAVLRAVNVGISKRAIAPAADVHVERGVVGRDVHVTRKQDYGHKDQKGSHDHDRCNNGRLVVLVQLIQAALVIFFGCLPLGKLLFVKAMGVDHGQGDAYQQHNERHEVLYLHRQQHIDKHDQAADKERLARYAVGGVPVVIVCQRQARFNAHSAVARDLGHIVAKEQHANAECKRAERKDIHGLGKGNGKENAAGCQRDSRHRPQHELENALAVGVVLVHDGGKNNAEPMHQQHHGGENEENAGKRPAVCVVQPPVFHNLGRQEAAAEKTDQHRQQNDHRGQKYRPFICFDHRSSPFRSLIQSKISSNTEAFSS